MGLQGMYDLTFASYYSNRIKALCVVPGVYGIIEDIVFLQLKELAEFISREKDPVSVRGFARMIINEFGNRLSISSIAHWVYLIMIAKEPFDKELFGFDKRRLITLLHTYINEQKKWVQNREKQEDEAVSLPVRSKLLATAISKNKEASEKFKALAEKMDVKNTYTENRKTQYVTLEQWCKANEVDIIEKRIEIEAAAKKDYNPQPEIPFELYCQMKENLFLLEQSKL